MPLPQLKHTDYTVLPCHVQKLLQQMHTMGCPQLTHCCTCIRVLTTHQCHLLRTKQHCCTIQLAHFFMLFCMHHLHAVMTKPALREVFVLLSAYPTIGLSLQGCCWAQQSHGPATVRTVNPVASRNSSKHKQTMQKYGPGASESLSLASFVTHDPCQGMAGIEKS